MKALGLTTFVILLAALTVAGIVAGDGNLGLAIGPPLALAALYAIWKLPLRWPVLIVTFLALTLENPGDAPACGQWRSPIYVVGAVFLAHLNVTLPYKALLFSGMDLILVYLFALVFVRDVTGSPIHRVGQFQSASPMRLFAATCLGGAAWMWAYGMAQGGADVASSLWQVQRVVYLPLIFFLLQSTLRNRADHAALGKVVVAAACIKACLAIYIRATVPPPPGQPILLYATTHTDSMLFATAFCLVVLGLLEQVIRRRLLGWSILALLIAGMVANQRRLVWVEVAAGLGIVFALSPWTRLKRSLARIAIIASPILLVYATVGWSASSALFRPVQVIRSVVDSKADPSTMWRDLENYDLFYTVRHNPILGTGYGHGYIEIVKLPDVSDAYALYRFIPHNSILGLWAYGGLIGFSALWSMIAVAMFLGARAHIRATSANDRAAALGSMAAIVVYLVHCYGDLGLGTWTSVFTVAPAFAVASHLAVATGAWPTRSRVRQPRAPTIRVMGGAWAPAVPVSEETVGP